MFIKCINWERKGNFKQLNQRITWKYFANNVILYVTLFEVVITSSLNLRYVFFADWLKDADNFPFIGRCHGDGRNMTKIHRYELGWPNGMCLDYKADRLYWVDAYFDRLK